MIEQPITLPPIRGELKVLQAMPSSDGEQGYLIHDPVKNAYYSIGARAAQILRQWSHDNIENVIEKINQSIDTPVTLAELEEIIKFLYANHLTVSSADGSHDVYLQQEAAASPPLWKQLVHKYLFFRVPLFYPDKFLKATFFLAKPFFKKSSWMIISLLGLLGLFLVSRQWDVFWDTFLHFLSFEGAIFYAISLFVIMGLHELGHAYAAHYYRCRVTTIGVAFLVMFPVMYTDITDAWQLTDKKQRLVIDFGGVAVELIIAVIATLLWSFLPDGFWRSIAFFSATTSWILSLAVNLNPFMRFDGYYIFSDMIGVSNLQERSFALGKWKLREYLFGLGHVVPEKFSQWQTLGLAMFAWGTWIYRFFLFLGIALFVHAFFAKALGIILFIIEISWFIVKPISKEVRMWFEYRAEILTSRRGKASIIATLCFVALFCIPLSATVKVPAILKPTQQTQIFPPTAGIITEIYVQEGDFVEKGAPLVSLGLPDIQEDYQQTLIAIALIEARLSRLGADAIDLSNHIVLKRSLLSEQKRASGLMKQLTDAKIVAPHAGYVNNLYKEIHTNQWVDQELLLVNIVNNREYKLLAMPLEQQIERISMDNHIKFIADDILVRQRSGTVVSIGKTSKKNIDDPVFSSTYGGRIAVREDKFGQHIPNNAIVEIKAQMLPLENDKLQLAVLGVAHIKAKPESFLKMTWRRIVAVFIREADF